MSTTPPVPPTPATPPPAGMPPAGPKQTTSIIGFVLGLVSVVFGWVALIGVGAGIAGLIVSRKAKKTEPGAPSWMHTIGLIASIVGIVIGVISFIVFIIATLIPLLTLGTVGTYTG
ncbi:MAG: hypothetical protein ABIQ01_07085 [Pseudolysinimonas sp.]